MPNEDAPDDITGCRVYHCDAIGWTQSHKNQFGIIGKAHPYWLDVALRYPGNAEAGFSKQDVGEYVDNRNHASDLRGYPNRFSVWCEFRHSWTRGHDDVLNDG